MENLDLAVERYEQVGMTWYEWASDSLDLALMRDSLFDVSDVVELGGWN